MQQEPTHRYTLTHYEITHIKDVNDSWMKIRQDVATVSDPSLQIQRREKSHILIENFLTIGDDTPKLKFQQISDFVQNTLLSNQSSPL
jgi:hypothetical protein